MLPVGKGSIIVIASIAGMSGHRGFFPAYTAAKAALIQVARNMGSAWASRGVRVNAIAPGWFPTEMTEGLLGIPAFADMCDRMTPAGRLGRPEELVGPLLLLASDAGSYVTGSVVAVDGGWTSTTGSSPASDEAAFQAPAPGLERSTPTVRLAQAEQPRFLELPRGGPDRVDNANCGSRPRLVEQVLVVVEGRRHTGVLVRAIIVPRRRSASL
jgi:hypothetical protein